MVRRLAHGSDLDFAQAATGFLPRSMWWTAAWHVVMHVVPPIAHDLGECVTVPVAGGVATQLRVGPPLRIVSTGVSPRDDFEMIFALS